MNLNDVSTITIPEGEVKEIAVDGVVIWTKKEE